MQVRLPLRNDAPQVAQREDTHRRRLRVNNHDAADAGLMHALHGGANGGAWRACNRVAYGNLCQYGIQRIVSANGFRCFTLHLQVDLLQQAADTAQRKIPEHW